MQILCIDSGSRHVGSVILEPRVLAVPVVVEPWNATTEEFMGWLHDPGPAETVAKLREEGVTPTKASMIIAGYRGAWYRDDDRRYSVPFKSTSTYFAKLAAKALPLERRETRK